MKIDRLTMLGATIGFIAVASLGVSYARQFGSPPPAVPDHPLIRGPISFREAAPFNDASTLWLSDVLAASGAQARGKRAKFNETTIIYKQVFLNAFVESIYRHKEWVPDKTTVAVGGPVEDVKPISATQYAALKFIVEDALSPNSKGDLVADENGLRGKVSLSDLSLTSFQLRRGTDQKLFNLRRFLFSGGGNP